MTFLPAGRCVMSKKDLRRSCIDCTVTACDDNGAKYST